MGLRNSSSKISPGAIAGPNQFGSLVIVFDADFVRMSLLPEEGYSILIIDSDAVAPRLISFQPFQSVASRNREVF
jgi:hypothetical protein